MTQVFSSSAKCLSHYCDVPAVQKLMAMFGNRLEGLSQEEKYQLCTAIGLHLWGSVEPVELDADAPFNDLEFADLFEEGEPDLITTQNDQLVPEVSANVMSALVILQNETPDSLSFLLPAIAEYARDDHR